jgi:AcrR family transcriptional regulator
VPPCLCVPFLSYDSRLPAIAIILDSGIIMTGVLKLASGRRERKKEEARQRLYKAAIHLFKIRGYESTTVQEISDLADTAKATFFNYFPTKEHILAAYHDDMTRSILNTISLRKDSFPTQDILGAMQVFAEWTEKTGPIGRILLRVYFTGEVLQDTDQKNEKKLRKWFQNRVRLAVQQGELEPNLDVDMFASLILAVLSSTVQEWILSDGAFALRPLLEKRITFLLRSAAGERQTLGILRVKRSR